MNENPDFMKIYFPKGGYEYPDVSGPMPILEYGHLWSYISSTFLDGFLNYPKIISAMTVPRYDPAEESQKALEKFKAAEKGELIHTTIGKWFPDDIHLLGTSENAPVGDDPEVFWYFWFDRDVSDCSIGRFQTKDPVELVTARFREWCHIRATDPNKESGEQGSVRAIEIPIERFCGWKSF